LTDAIVASNAVICGHTTGDRLNIYCWFYFNKHYS